MNDLNNKKVSAPIGIIIIAICGVITLVSMISALKKYTNYNDVCLYNENC